MVNHDEIWTNFIHFIAADASFLESSGGCLVHDVQRHGIAPTVTTSDFKQAGGRCLTGRF